MEYLKSVLRQEVGFFDTQVGSSTNFEVITAISGDAQLIQDVMADKVLILFMLFLLGGVWIGMMRSRK